MNHESVKRIEIVIDQPHLPLVIEALRSAGADGWTILREVSGSGGRGEQWADDLSGSGSNVAIIVASPPEIAVRIARAIGPIIREAGGLYLVSDATRLRP